MTDDEKYLAVIDRMIDLEQALRAISRLVTDTVDYVTYVGPPPGDPADYYADALRAVGAEAEWALAAAGEVTP